VKNYVEKEENFSVKTLKQNIRQISQFATSIKI